MTIEVFHMSADSLLIEATDPGSVGADRYTAEDPGVPRAQWCEDSAGWYYWECAPGCLPDSEPEGPFETEREATRAAAAGMGPVGLLAEMHLADGNVTTRDGMAVSYHYADLEDVTVRVSNPDRENGCQSDVDDERPLGWINSARLTLDPDDDAIHCVVSVADPRGGFCVTFRRLPDGRIAIHVPTPDDGAPHVELEPHHNGTLITKGRF